MASNQSHSAKIYSFPKGGRAGMGANPMRSPQMMAATIDIAARGPEILSTDGWYHEAAMQSDRDRKN